MQKNRATFRFYEELNDFLPLEKRKVAFSYDFNEHPAIKDAIEAIGVPHPEVDLILVNGKSVGFDYQLQNGDCASIYPVFESLDIAPIIKLREKPLRSPKFILDVHLGKLTKHMRLLGFDCQYDPSFLDSEIIKHAVAHQQIILTRDKNLLKNKRVTHGYWLRSTEPSKQLKEVIRRFALEALIKPFIRCITCNGEIQPIAKKQVIDDLPPLIRRDVDEFYRCQACSKVYWKGSHYQQMQTFIQSLNLKKGI